MSEKDILKAFTARLIRYIDDLHNNKHLSDSAYEILTRSIQLQSADEILRYEIPKDASPLAKALLEELQSL